MTFIVFGFATLLLMALAWILIEVHRSSISYKLLVLVIPLTIGAPFALSHFLQTQMGYATSDMTRLYDEQWVLVSATADDKSETVYALVRHPDGLRLYAVTGEYEKNKKAFLDAAAKAGMGALLSGKREGDGTGGVNDGSFMFYPFVPQDAEHLKNEG